MAGWYWIDFKEIGCEVVDCFQLGAFVNTVMNLRVQQKAGNVLTSWVTIRFSRRTVLHGVLFKMYIDADDVRGDSNFWIPHALRPDTRNSEYICVWNVTWRDASQHFLKRDLVYCHRPDAIFQNVSACRKPVLKATPQFIILGRG
jgi:hypothetical protein